METESHNKLCFIVRIDQQNSFPFRFFNLPEAYASFQLLEFFWLKICRPLSTLPPPSLSLRSDHIYMKYLHSAESNEKTYFRFFQFLFFQVMVEKQKNTEAGNSWMPL